MKITVKNAGVIKKAEIKLNGITVIAGKNGTGKSTLGKLLYCMGRTLYQADNNVREERARQIAFIVSNRTRGQIGAGYVRVYPREAYELVDTYNLSGVIEYPERIDELIQYSESKEEIHKHIKEALEISPLTILTNMFDRILEIEMGKNIFPINHPGRVLQVKLELDQKKNIEVRKEKGKDSEFKTNETLNSGVIVIDDPYIVDELSENAGYGVIINRFSHKAYLEEILIRSKDRDSVISQIVGRNSWEELSGIMNEMCEGELRKSSSRGFEYYSSKYREPLSIESLSTGVKSILLIKTLIENGKLNDIGLLVVDEPEVHLHPEWQFQLAKILVLLPKMLNVKVLLSTHSSDFLSAIEYYTKQYQMQESTNYYQARKEGDYSTIEEVTDQLDRIYQDLSASFLAIAEEL